MLAWGLRDGKRIYILYYLTLLNWLPRVKFNAAPFVPDLCCK